MKAYERDDLRPRPGDGARYQCFLFGKPCFLLDGRELDASASVRVQELFCYLLVHRNQPHTREALCALLWEEVPSDKSKKYLRQTLWQLQRFLAGDPGHPAPLEVDAEWVRLNPKADIWLDVDQFEKVFTSTRKLNGHELGPLEAELLRETVELYQGDLLQGWYQEWCILERERMQKMNFDLLEKLMDHCAAQSQYEDGLAYGFRILRSDPVRESTHQRIMRLYCGSGNRPEALRHFERFAVTLGDELNVAPSRSTLTLVDQIRQDRLDLTPPTPSPERPRSGPEPGNLAEVLDSLRRLNATLSALQDRVQHDIQAVERALHITH